MVAYVVSSSNPHFATVDLFSRLWWSVELNCKFPLELYPLGKGLLDSSILIHYLHIIPLSVSTNITFNNYMLHYTSTESVHHFSDF